MFRALFLLLFFSFPALAQDLNIPESEPIDSQVKSEQEKPTTPATKKTTKPAKEKKTPKKSSTEEAKEEKPEKPPESNIAILQGLNKVTGQSYSLNILLGTVSRFENLEIIARRCQKIQTKSGEDNAALLEIREVKVNEQPKQLFLGWMFSSSPSLSNLEHPVYDVTIISCGTGTEEPPESGPTK